MSEPLSYNDRLLQNARVDELNSLALAENLADLRQTYDARFQALENEIRRLNELVQAQTQMIGVAVGQIWGGGPTEGM